MTIVQRNQNVIVQISCVQGQQSKTFKTGFKNQPTSKPQSSNAGFHRAYDAAEYYRQRREYQLKKIKEEEEKMRRHKAKPMPNFKAIHSKALTTVKESTEMCISPETPEVLRRGLAMKEKQKQKVRKTKTLENRAC